MSTIDELLKRSEFDDRPPVLVDIGASGELPSKWKPLAKYSVCIAFDADDRDFDAKASRATPYRKLHLHNCIVSVDEAPELDFHLTRSPYCSSTLLPKSDELADWIFADLFDVERTVRLKSRRLPDILAEHELSYVDSFKTDSQGTDLRLFLSLGESVHQKVLEASFEPGLIDAYAGEDKLHGLLAKMDELPFWIHDIEVRGTQRLTRKLWEEQVRPQCHGAVPLTLKTSPGWAEVSYLNTMRPADRFDRRDFFLSWILASLNDQHGFALEVATVGRERFTDAIFSRMAEESLAKTVTVVDRVLPSQAKRVVNFARDLAGRILR